MPKVTKCIKGHFYDSERFDACPYCDNVSKNDVVSSSYSDGPEYTVPAAAANVTVAANKVSQPTQSAYAPNGPTQNAFAPNGPTQNAYASNSQNQSLDAEVADAQKTVAKFTTKNNGKEPVVGWLVCIDGKHYGEDFRLKAGNNFIGRDRTMDVVLANDNSVSRNKHVIVIYDPVSNSFIVRAGESHELSYLNGQIILEPRTLNIYDKLSIGSTTLMFIPLASKEFTWEEK